MVDEHMINLKEKMMSNVKLKPGGVYLDGYNNIIEIKEGYRPHGHNAWGNVNTMGSLYGSVTMYRRKDGIGFEYMENGHNNTDSEIANMIDFKPYDKLADIVKEYDGEEVVSTDTRDQKERIEKIHKLSKLYKEASASTHIRVYF